MRYLITGGAGFIGSNFIHYLLKKYSDAEILNYDKLTYAGNLDNLKSIENDKRYRFIKADINDSQKVIEVFNEFKPEIVVNFAAETHVDRSIMNPSDFILTDMYGVYNLLEASKNIGIKKFIQISTDEVYGSIKEGAADENYPLMPTNPYSASKAGGDRMAYAYYKTYGVPVIITRASNNFGPYQYPEKLIPLFVTNVLEDKSLPIYGDGMQIRDWLFVEDHCSAIDFLINNGIDGEVYNIAGGNEKPNIYIINKIIEVLGKGENLKKYVQDRPGHDRRYALDSTKLKKLGWSPSSNFEEALKFTINWYVENKSWWQKLKSGEYLEYYKKQYEKR